MANKTVLLIEQDQDEERNILALFKKHLPRISVCVVRSKSEAMEYIFQTGSHRDRHPHETPDLILLDLAMDRTEEVKQLKHLHSYLRTYSLPIIILINSEEQEEEVRRHDIGCVEFIRKPLNPFHLMEVVQKNC